jgi:dsRNA-specific ribonuclease
MESNVSNTSDNKGEIKESETLYNPYNPLNVEITLNDIQSILIRYNIVPKVNNIELYKRAFVHKSYTNENESGNNEKICECPNNCVKLKTKSNERLEFLGDGILECITKYYLYKRFPKENERFTELALVALGGRGAEEEEKYREKIIKNVLKEVVIDKASLTH